MRKALHVLLLVLAALPAAAQIADNSFLVEEAYNQEPGVVQHIAFFSRSTRDGAWESNFTQEWPLQSLKHQLSYSVTGSRETDSTRFGDALLNYRYQLVGDGESRLAISPRISAVIPTRSGESMSVQLMLPVSTTLGSHAVAHWNAGGTFGHGAPAWTAAQSLVWLIHPRFNALVETVWTGSRDASDLVISPGIRWSHNLASGLQIVPGIAVPVTVRGDGGRSVFVYLSFEHPFRRNS